jgi:DHA2 family multidrug resistance protein
VQGLGFGCVFLPLNLMAFGTIDPLYRTQGAGLYSLARSMSGSIGISLMATLIARQTQVSHADLAQYISGASSAVTGMIGGGTTPGTMMTMVNGEVTRQATMIAYIDAFIVMFWFSIIASPLILLLRTGPSKPAATAEDAGHAMAME